MSPKHRTVGEWTFKIRIAPPLMRQEYRRPYRAIVTRSDGIGWVVYIAHTTPRAHTMPDNVFRLARRLLRAHLALI